MAAGDATPAIGVDVFGEIQITGVPAGMKLSEIMAGSSNIEITATPATATKGTATFTHVASVVGQGVKIALSDYSWGASYAIKATYTVNQTDYVIAGTIETAAAPTEVKYDFAPVTIGYEDKAITGNWGAIYTAWKGDFAGFKDAAEFTAAIFDKSVVAVTDTKLINTANPTPGQDVAASNGTKMVATAVALTGDLKKADITADEDKFVQTAAWETWYGQKVTVTMTYDVALPEYVLTPNDAWVNADGVVGTKGEVDATTEKWSVKLQGAVKDYFYFAPASNLIAKTYVKKSVDGTPVNSVYAKVSGAADSPQVSWENGTTTMKDVVMTAKLVLDSKVDVATKDFTIRADDPIATFTQAAAQDAKYVPNGKLEVNLLKGISLKDINGKEWIKADGVGETTTTNNYLANTVFGMTTGNDATIGIAFGKPTNDANLSLELVDNKLSYSNDGSVLLKDVTVTIPAKITYWLGEKTVDVKVIIKK